MFDLSLKLPNWSGHRRGYTTGHFKWFHFARHGRISKTRGWEIQLDYWGWRNLFKFVIDLDTKGSDHAGPCFELCILGFTVEISFRDGRHWNYEDGRFFEPGEEVAYYDDGELETEVDSA